MTSQPKIFRPSKLKSSILLLGCSVFVAIGVSVLKEDPLMGWLGISFFGLGVIASFIQFFPNSTYLKLTDEGFEVKGLFRSNFTKWEDVKAFRKGHVKGNKMILFDYTETHKKWNKGKKVAKFLSGNEGAIQSSYTISTNELLELMIAYKKKAKSKTNE